MTDHTALRFHPSFVGASPWAPGSAIYSGIQGLEWEEGVWFPEGGTNALVRALEAYRAGHIEVHALQDLQREALGRAGVPA